MTLMFDVFRLGYVHDNSVFLLLQGQKGEPGEPGPDGVPGENGIDVSELTDVDVYWVFQRNNTTEREQRVQESETILMK